MDTASNPDQRFDPRAYRQALGCFATGVAVVTTLTSEKKSIGMTINSFSSVSLDPPLVMWNLRVSSGAYQIFMDAPRFSINLLSREQMDLSARFATRETDKFDNLEVELGLGEIPLLPGCVANFECTRTGHYMEGDHVLFIGRVDRFKAAPQGEPLVYCRGNYLVN